MDKADLILERLTAMDRAFRSEMKTLNDKIDRVSDEVKQVSRMQKLTWEAVKDLDKEVVRHDDEINKIKAL
ncbi:hypothetical protein Dhaf_2713 [Desulfitobacterium hafniense DCB-2]|uniref:Uncharacterized protein n=1 Tax=Desulfitobacterium hafniense (strain DSM 10664 / DCB-2) TaxID=272564 RepID=B8FWC7_DESHD|nr:hypothetical protein [Desulfitobacterium hafniense]ACL20739.1 hypothetical protein Dhaf_2713 [Desulfitobacterium hafniense DCB-2]